MATTQTQLEPASVTQLARAPVTRFIYFATATPFSANRADTSPIAGTDIALTHAPSLSLPAIGGDLANVDSGLCLKVRGATIATVGRVTAKVSGRPTGTTYTTVATTLLENVDIMGLVKADRIFGSVTSVYPVNGGGGGAAAAGAAHPSLFSLKESSFANLTIDGHGVEPRQNAPLAQAGLSVLTTTVFQGFFYTANQQSSVVVPGLGTVSFGFVDVFGSRVSLSMLRIETPDGLVLECSTQSGNGHDGTG